MGFQHSCGLAEQKQEVEGSPPNKTALGKNLILGRLVF